MSDTLIAANGCEDCRGPTYKRPDGDVYCLTCEIDNVVIFEDGDTLVTVVGERIKHPCGCLTINEVSGEIFVGMPFCNVEDHVEGFSYNAPKWWKHSEFVPGRKVDDDLYKVIGTREVWTNCCYQVWIYRDVTKIPPVPGKTKKDIMQPPDDWPVVTWLSIKLNKKEKMKDFRQLQIIKNLLLGPEVEAVELYPAESRLKDAANQYHLWCLPTDHFFPIGMLGRGLSTPESAAKVAAVQEPWEDSVHES